MNYICIGKIVNTHGIKGELRILSNFKFKETTFLKNNKIYIGNKKEEEIINSYRKHKNFDMITLKGYENINDILKYKGSRIYIIKENLTDDNYYDEDLIGLQVYINNNKIGIIKDTIYIKNNSLFVIEDKNKIKYIPNNKEFIESIDLDNKKVYIKYMEGLIE